MIFEYKREASDKVDEASCSGAVCRLSRSPTLKGRAARSFSGKASIRLTTCFFFSPTVVSLEVFVPIISKILDSCPGAGFCRYVLHWRREEVSPGSFVSQGPLPAPVRCPSTALPRSPRRRRLTATTARVGCTTSDAENRVLVFVLMCGDCASSPGAS